MNTPEVIVPLVDGIVGFTLGAAIAYTLGKEVRNG